MRRWLVLLCVVATSCGGPSISSVTPTRAPSATIRPPTATPAPTATVAPTFTPMLFPTITRTATQQPTIAASNTVSPMREAPSATVRAVVPPTAAVSGFACDKCIKGNINSEGVKIYHLPACRDYERTVIDTGKGEKWFSSEGEARAAGWRIAENCR